MSEHVVSYDTGHPAPFTYGPGKFFTREFILERLLLLKNGDPLEDDSDEEFTKAGTKSVTRYKPRPRKAPVFPKICKLESCQKEFLGNKKETLCSPECRQEWTRQYQRSRKRYKPKAAER